MHPLVYLTGIPASGKSTLVSLLRQRVPKVQILEYSELLCRHLSEKYGRQITHAELRSASSSLIERSDVQYLDRFLLEYSKKIRRKNPVVIVSHAVTREKYGFRMVPFTSSQWRSLRVSAICMLSCAPREVRRRISINPSGRPSVSDLQAQRHFEMQAALIGAYSFVGGIPVYIFETDGGVEKVLPEFIQLLS